MKLTLPKRFSQADPAWASVKLGNSSICTIKSDGCLLTDVAMVCAYFGKDTDPQKLNTDLIRVKGFVNGANLVYSAITEIYPDIQVDWDNYIDCSTTPAPLDKIDVLLANKKPVIVKVDYDKNTAKLDQHWVTIIGKAEDGAYICNDPIDGTEIFFHARYGEPQRYIFKIVAYNGPLPTNIGPEDRIADLEAKVISLNTQVAELSLENNTLRTDLSTQEKDNADLAHQLGEARSERDKTDWEKKQAELKVDAFAKTIEDLKKDVDVWQTGNKALKIDLVKAREASAEELTTGELLKIIIDRWFKRGVKKT